MHPIHERVLAFIDDPSADSFELLALSVYRHQFETIEAYRRYCSARDRTPESVSTWREVPPVPIEAFKHVALSCAPAERLFLSTGTTAGPHARSRHMIPDLRLYRRSAVTALRKYLFPDVERMTILSLVHPAELMPQSSLAQMVAWAVETFGDEGSCYAMTEDGLNFELLESCLRDSERTGRSACLMTTTAALVHVVDEAERRGWSFRLPHGSRLMDTGGDKGAPRRLSRKGILHACWKIFAIPGYFCVNEYGMAELSSQFYENVVEARVAGRFCHRALAGPHWTRTRVLDPLSLEDVPRGANGLLCHYDLANAGTAMAVLTEDIGRQVEEGFELLGRATGAEVRGCSLSLAEWQAA